jgi:PTH1 family peptidyl-tRNA hydrolase
MWIITGLGNPGTKYTETRHNIGFRVITLLADKYAISFRKDMLYALGEGFIEGERVLLVKPLTFMNRSGVALKDLINSLEGAENTLIVVHDDIDLDTGVVRIRRRGSSGGHKGVESIIHQLLTEDFIRVKVGIGRKPDISVEQYVLDRFEPFEENIIKNAIIEASSAIVKIVAQGVEFAMNEINRPLKELKSD